MTLRLGSHSIHPLAVNVVVPVKLKRVDFGVDPVDKRPEMCGQLLLFDDNIPLPKIEPKNLRPSFNVGIEPTFLESLFCPFKECELAWPSEVLPTTDCSAVRIPH
jgi:hypothetical protein